MTEHESNESVKTAREELHQVVGPMGPQATTDGQGIQGPKTLWKTINPTPTPFRRPKTPGRNDPCPCGSGKKAKKCHLAKIKFVLNLPPAVREAMETEAMIRKESVADQIAQAPIVHEQGKYN